MDGVERLANAIILQAAKDYRAARRKIRKKPDNREAQAEIASIRRFFLSQWFSALSDADGSYILRKLDGEG